MPLEHVIAHHLKRSTDSEAVLTLRTEELPKEGHSETLLGQLKQSFLARISREHGSFDSKDGPTPLPQALEAFLSREHSFIDLSSTLMEYLKQMVEKSQITLDAHFFFFHEKSFDHDLFHLFVTGQTESLSLNDKLELVPSYAIDTGAGLFGIKVDLAEWREHRNYAYLSLLPPRGNRGLSEAFTELTGFANGIDKEEATLAFLEGVENYANELPEDKVDDYRNQVVEYCMAQEEQDSPVDIRGLAQSMDGIDTDAFVRTLAGQAPQGEQGLRVDRRSLRRYVKFTGREKDLAISFNAYQLNKRIHYYEETDTLSIEGIPSALRKQLLEHMNH